MGEGSKAGLLAGLAEVEHVSITTGGVTYVGFPAGTLGTFVVASLHAAFPILAEELVAWHDAQALVARGCEVAYTGGRVRHGAGEFHEWSARSLRARIEQMKEITE